MPEYTLHLDLNGLTTTRQEENKQILKQVNDPNNIENEDTAKDSNKIGRAIYKSAKAHMVSTAMQLGTSYASNIGAREDNIAKQNRINNMMSIGTKLVSSSMSVAVTTAVNPVLGVITATSIAAKEGIDIYNRLEDYNRNQLQNQLESVRATERLGNICTGRNR